jgi:hypothetical protein
MSGNSREHIRDGPHPSRRHSSLAWSQRRGGRGHVPLDHGPEAGPLLSYNNFAPGQPDNFLDEDYVEIFGFAATCCGIGQWNDLVLAGTPNNGYVIEWTAPPSRSVPEPSTLTLLGSAVGLAVVSLLRRSIS